MLKTALTDQLEAILFVATEPLALAKLAAATKSSEPEVTTALATLSERLTGGIRLSHLEGKYCLVTAPEAAAAVEQFLQAEAAGELSKPALETLAIVAYRGPLTRAAVEAIRGVSSDTMLRNLTARGLIREAGRSPEPGRPTLYAISHTFLHHFGLTDPSQLPPLPEAAPSNNEN